MQDEQAKLGAEHAPLQLPVLTSSNKVEQLKEQIRTDLAACAQPSADYSPHVNRVKWATAKPLEKLALEEKVVQVLRSVFDPEIPVNIYELGLIYDIDIDDENNVQVRMTLTAPGCPVAGTMPGEVERKIENIPEVASAAVELVWEPQWTKEMMSEAARLDLGFL